MQVSPRFAADFSVTPRAHRQMVGDLGSVKKADALIKKTERQVDRKLGRFNDMALEIDYRRKRSYGPHEAEVATILLQPHSSTRKELPPEAHTVTRGKANFDPSYPAPWKTVLKNVVKQAKELGIENQVQ